MIPISKLFDAKILVVHGNCPDGLASAMIIRQALPAIELKFLNHGTDEYYQLPAVPGMIFCDIIPPPHRIEEFISAGAVCLDHHKQAEVFVKMFGELGMFGDEKHNPGVSGAVLACREVFERVFEGDLDRDFSAIQEFATLIGVRDTFYKEHPEWQTACEVTSGLNFYSPEEMLAMPAAEWLPICKNIGKVLYQRNLKAAEKSIKTAHTFTSALGTRVLIFEGTKASSNAADLLDQDYDLVIGYASQIISSKLQIIFSTRSHTNFDCGAFCSAQGGGGHTQAAGFTYFTHERWRYTWWQKILSLFQDPQRTISHPFYLFEQILHDYEMGLVTSAEEAQNFIANVQ